MKRNDQNRRWLPAFAYAAGVAGVMAVVGFSALVQSGTQSADAASCDVLPVIRAVDAAEGVAPERLMITIVGKRAPELAGTRPEATQPGRQS